jgi:serine protease AprX
MMTAYKSFPSSTSVTDPTTGITYTDYYDIFTVGAGYVDIANALANSSDLAVGNAMSPSVSINTQTGTATLVFNPSSVWAQQSLWASQSEWAAQTIWGQSEVNANNTLWASQSLWAEQSLWAQESLWGQASLWGQESLSSEETLWGQETIWGQGTSISDPISTMIPVKGGH